MIIRLYLVVGNHNAMKTALDTVLVLCFIDLSKGILSHSFETLGGLLLDPLAIKQNVCRQNV